MIEYKFDKGHIPDNDISYFSILDTTICSVDQYSSVRIDKTPTHYLFRISPTSSNYINSIIKQINTLNNSLQLKTEYGKSFKNNSNIFISLTV
jgi:hypothetical protein